MPRLRPGHPAPLGATWTGTGTNFALFSAHATAVELCLFDQATDAVEAEPVRLAPGDDGVWYAEVEGVGPGTLYGYRVWGPYAPDHGHQFNPA
jgi:isoamylase